MAISVTVSRSADTQSPPTAFRNADRVLRKAAFECDESLSGQSMAARLSAPLRFTALCQINQQGGRFASVYAQGLPSNFDSGGSQDPEFEIHAAIVQRMRYGIVLLLGAVTFLGRHGGSLARRRQIYGVSNRPIFAWLPAPWVSSFSMVPRQALPFGLKREGPLVKPNCSYERVK